MLVQLFIVHHSSFIIIRRLLLCAIALLWGQWAAAQTADSTAFPASWAGTWAGTLDIYAAKGKVQSVPMEVEVARLDTSTQGRYVFSLMYGSREKDYRPYELVPVDPEKGLWRVDEKNSIAMEAYLRGPKLLCWFTVQGSRILTIYEKTEDAIIFEVVAGSETAVSTTGNTKQGAEDIPEVKTFPFSAYQRAVLRKQ